MSNPFDDDIDVASFYKPQNKSGKQQEKSPSSEDFNFYEQQIEQILQNTVDSSNRGAIMLEESEQIGIATAHDLIQQGEKLTKVDRQLDEINVTTKHSQKHLNNIKSIFGGFKNYFSKPAPPMPNSGHQKPGASNSDSRLSSAVDKLGQQAQRDYASAGGASFAAPGSSSLSESTRATLAGTRWEVMNNQVEENLDQMSSNLRRLRDLGSALGQEIDQQNTMLDTIAVKAERADTEIRYQDRQMKKILGGGKAKPTAAVDQSQDSAAASASTTPPSIFGGRFKK